MRTLDRKLWRDLSRLWSQALAIALVQACGVATLVLAVGSFQSLLETRTAYYERYRFAEVFAQATRAPQQLTAQIGAIAGVATVEARIVQPVLLDIAGMREPATGQVLSLPDHRQPVLNRLFMRQGRTPQPGRSDEVIVNESFAQAHGFQLGARFSAIMNGSKRELQIVGIALSPEFVYALGPGDLVPDARRFGLIWMSESALAGLYDLEGAFNDLSLRLLRGANQTAVIEQLDQLIAPYGGAGAHARDEHPSHAFLDSELEQLRAMSRVIPPIFLLVSAFLVNIVLSRLVALEREQIGLLKAVGYGRWEVTSHYLKLIAMIALLGVLIGAAVGTWLGQGLTRLYADFFHFPFLLFQRDPLVYLLAVGVSLLAAFAGGAGALASVLNLPPAVAMRPPAPPIYRRWISGRLAAVRALSQLTIMGFRHLLRWPLRSFLTALGASFAVALLVLAIFSFDSIDYMIEVSFDRAERQDATLHFFQEAPPAAAQALAQLPGVLQLEPARTMAARLRHGHRSRLIAIQGRPAGADLGRLLDLDHQPLRLPETGLAISEHVAKLLALRRGDLVQVEFLEGQRRVVETPVTEVFQSYFGLVVAMDQAALDQLAGGGPRIDSARVLIDDAQLDALYQRIKNLPVIGTVALQRLAVAQFRATIRENIAMSVAIYVSFSVIIAFGIVYNSARIQLSLHGRELASLRVLGFQVGEVARVLMTELGLIVLLAQPLGWLLGYGFAWGMLKGFESDLYRIPLVVAPSTFAIASIVVLSASAVSALIVLRRLGRLDLIAVLKTRE